MTINLDRYLVKTVPLLKRADLQVSKAVWASWRTANGAPSRSYVPLLTAPADNTKLAKSPTPTWGLTLAPAGLSGFNTCTWSTPLCRKGCLNTAGKGLLSRVQRGRILKTRFLAEHPAHFLRLLEEEIIKARVRDGEILVRLNVLSDLRWELIAPWLFQIQGVRFYDYTKSQARASAANGADGNWPNNYRLIYSATERDSDDLVDAMLLDGVSVAMVFDRIPEAWNNGPVIDGDKSDDRWTDIGEASTYGVLVALKAKGKMRDGTYGGFVRTAQGALVGA